ncbi:MAG: citrate/2-methylcitrate synthase [Thermoplasmatota archaeon]
MSGKGGLEGISVGKTAISSIDGIAGKLWYRGYSIQDLAAQSTFEEVSRLLWFGELPTWKELEDFRTRLTAARAVSPEVLAFTRASAEKSEPMDFLRTIVSFLGMLDVDTSKNDREALLRKSFRVSAQIPTVLAAFDRYRRGLEALSPDPTLDHAANFLYMLQAKKPDEEIARSFDVCLLLHADHHFNASTFSARVTASTLSDLHSAITSAVGTLKGPLHGGANEGVMRMLLEIDQYGDPRAYIRNKLAQKEKVMGFGHRVYKTLDPRAVPLRDISERLGRRSGNLKWFEESTRVQEIMKQEKGLDANVDFYSASAYTYMGIPTDLMTPIFAMARSVGWCAHVMEQLAENRLIRPDAEYVGPAPRPYVALDRR